ncbi:MAG: SDR family oxidoreductase [Gemmatimonadales bacterium]|nr:MAG: SDR family oxidoreductase [Gemmatimonadales bacterium]
MTAPLLDLSGKRALVTGGSRGVGAATARLLARAGARVAVGYRTRSADAAALCREIENGGGEALALGGDLSEESECVRLFDEAESALGGLDVFVGNHGIWPHRSVPLSDMTSEQWARTMRVNLDSLFWTTREAARRLAEGGRIVLVSSTAAQRGEAGHGDYAASKGAVVSLVKGLAVELAPRDITVNAVAPGWVDTEMAAPALQGPRLEEARRGIPLGRIASAEDVAGPIVFLASPLARHVTAEVLNVNGGAVRIG